MIAGSVGIPITGMYAVVVAIDWFIDRFRTMTNVSGDIFAARIMEKITGITDDNTPFVGEQEALERAMSQDNNEEVRVAEKKAEV